MPNDRNDRPRRPKPPRRKFYNRSDRPTQEQRERTTNGNERYCPISGKRSYTSKGQAIRALSDRFKQLGGAYQCPDCLMWHATRSNTPLAETVDMSADHAADLLVSALGIDDGDHDM